MRSYKKIMPILLTVALIGSAAYSFQSKAELKAEYSAELSEARRLSEMGVLSESMEHYGAAMEMHKTLPLALEIGETYLRFGDMDSARYLYNEVLLANYPKEAGTYYFGMRYCEQGKDYAGLFDAYEKYQERGLSMQEVEQLAEQYRYAYTLGGLYDEAGVFSTSSGLAAVKYNDRWGAINSSGARKVSYTLNKLGMIGEFGPAQTKDGRAIYIDASGKERINENFILEHDPEFGHVEEFKNIYDGLILAGNGTVWNYYRLDGFEKCFGGFADALPIYNGVGAVKKSPGAGWSLISKDGAELSSQTFDAIAVDGKDIFCRDGVLVASVNGVYGIYTATGEKLGAGGYSEAKAFNDNTLAAVKKNGRWIFVDQTGMEFDLGTFQEAESFSAGLAAVKIDDRWGYIDEQGQLVIDNIFFGASPMAKSGVGFVAVDAAQWQLLTLTRLKH